MTMSSTNQTKMPAAEPNGFVKTLNNMGYMTSFLDEFSKYFVEFAPIAPGPVLDIGAAYGIASLPALEGGATVIANDIDGVHLEILKERAADHLKSRLSLKTGAFPDQLQMDGDSLGAVLVCRVMHFFDGDTIERSAAILFEWLKSGGKAFIVAETPYLKNFQNFIPIYEKRRDSGEKWPGFIDDVMAIAPERGAFLPPKMHLLDPDVLSRTFKNAGFIIEAARTIARKDFPEDLQLDGRESVGIIARKP
jgi:SAM-dependent methyltransferase